MLPAAPVETLPSLVQRAASQLASAKSAAEVLEARDAAGIAYTAAKVAARLAKAKGAHDELIAAALRAQAEALKIQSLAKCRLAEEYDAAQARGEVKANGGDRTVPLPNSEDIGLSRKEIHEARQIRDAEEAEPGIIARTLDELVDAGEEPTKAAIRRIVHGPSPTRHKPSSTGEQLANLRRAWREACPEVRQHFLIEVSE